MKQTIFFLLLFISSFTFAQTFTTVEPVLHIKKLIGYTTIDSVLSISGGGHNGGTCLTPITGPHLTDGTITMISGGSFHSAVDDFKPKLDTIKIIIISIDTTLYAANQPIPYWQSNYNRLPIWDYAYSVRENYMGDNPNNGNGFGLHTSEYWLPVEAWRHKLYLDKNKKPLDKNTIIIQSIEIK